MHLDKLRLTMFFTAGVGMELWDRIGTLERELAIYRKLRKTIAAVNIVTYGGRLDKRYVGSVKDIAILPIAWFFLRGLTCFALLLRYRKQLLQTDIYKTNQIPGFDIAFWFSRLFKKKLIVRCGYVYSVFVREKKQSARRVKKALAYEKKACLSADRVIVATESDRRYLIETHGVSGETIRVIPNYVQVDTFRPMPDSKKKYDLMFVGRMSFQKNIELLFEALSSLKEQGREISLAIIGGGCLLETHKRLVAKLGLHVSFLGNHPHMSLPALMQQAKIFVLPSRFEGHPKALLEAMSCAMPCIGTDVLGTRDVVAHMKNGYLCKNDSDSLAHAIDALLADESLQQQLGKAAREYVCTHCSVDVVAQQELAVYSEVLR